MKRLRVIIICAFFIILLLPIIYFNWEENVVSEIDNRKLTNNPFGNSYTFDEISDLTTSIENYVEDRIGFRDDMILAYTLLNDKLFNEMVHPTYMYGREGYVFLKQEPNIEFSEYHKEFANMLGKIQRYCEERETPFIFVFNPSKSSVLTNKLGNGINYNNDWVQKLEKELDKKEVCYIDNTDLLVEKTIKGEDVFNKQYNAGHWNDLGAFYGVNNILEKMSEYFPNIHFNQKKDFNITQKLNTSLQVSQFPINEYEPIFEGNCELENLTDNYIDEMDLDYQYRYFQYLVNPKEVENDAPKTLVFQGSYMNGMGYKFLENSLGEYIAVHNYQNILNLDYYFNLFQPECVIFEVAEYTLTDAYFNYERMQRLEFNPSFNSVKAVSETVYLDKKDFKIEKKQNLTDIRVCNLPEDSRYVYLIIDGIPYDLRKKTDENGNDEYMLTIENAEYNDTEMIVKIVREGVI